MTGIDKSLCAVSTKPSKHTTMLHRTTLWVNLRNYFQIHHWILRPVGVSVRRRRLPQLIRFLRQFALQRGTRLKQAIYFWGPAKCPLNLKWDKVGRRKRKKKALCTSACPRLILSGTDLTSRAPEITESGNLWIGSPIFALLPLLRDHPWSIVSCHILPAAWA